jgi:sugar lactone lactonase YvrE
VPGSANATGTAARFAFPSGIALDRAGNLYVADTLNHTIRRIAAGTAAVTTLAGIPLAAGTADSTPDIARFNGPRGLCVDADGNVYVADTSSHTIRRVTPAGFVTTIAGFAGSPGSANGDGSAARFQFPWAVAVDAAGRLFVADNLGPIVRRIVAGTVTTIGGAPGSLSYADGSGAAARFHAPSGIAVDAQGNLYLTQHHNNIVAKASSRLRP